MLSILQNNKIACLWKISFCNIKWKNYNKCIPIKIAVDQLNGVLYIDNVHLQQLLIDKFLHDQGSNITSENMYILDITLCDKPNHFYLQHQIVKLNFACAPFNYLLNGYTPLIFKIYTLYFESR